MNLSIHQLKTYEQVLKYAKVRLEYANLPEESRMFLSDIEEALIEGISENEGYKRLASILVKLELASKYYVQKEMYEEAAIIRDAIKAEKDEFLILAKKAKWPMKSVKNNLSGATSEFTQSILK